MISNQPLTRPVLSVISENQLNINNNNNSNLPSDSSSFIKQNAHSTPIRSKISVLNNSSAINVGTTAIGNNKRSLNLDNDDDINVSPKLKRARLLKMKLQLAYFKVKTNQTEIPLNDLKLPNKKLNNNSIFNNTTLKKEHASKSLHSLKKSSMDDIVTKKGAFANLKRFNHEYTNKTNTNLSNKNNNNNNNISTSIPSSAPAGILSFNHNFATSSYNSNSNSNSVTSPSKFAISSVDNRHVRLPPVPKLCFPGSNIFQITQNTSFNDSTIDEKVIEKEATNETTILQNESTSTPLLRRRHSMDHVERNDPDMTILQSNSILMSTPVRQQKNIKLSKKSLTKSNQNKITLTSTTSSTNNSDFATPSSSKRKSLNSKNKSKQTNNNQNNNHNSSSSNNSSNNNHNNHHHHNNNSNNILKDDEDSQIMSSPTRLLFTPSSIGAAKCLLQLAHR